MIKAYLAVTKGASISISSSIDKMFGVVGFYQMIQTQEVESILSDCKYEREIYEKMA